MNRHTAAVLRHGEIFTDEQGRTLKGSIKASTRATYSLAARSCYYEGLIENNLSVGGYLTRKHDNKVYLINTLQPQPQSPELDYIYMAQCNTIATLARPKNAGTSADSGKAFEVYAKDVLIFKDTTTRSLQSGKDGLIPQDITIIHVPVRYGIKKLDRVYIVHEGVPLDSEDSEYYQVDSINTALIPLFDYVDFSGVEVQQLSADSRENKIYNPETDDSGGTGTEPEKPPDPWEW